MELLKLVALDEEDLRIISAHLQDSVLRVRDMAYLPRARRFVVLLNRFDWLKANSRWFSWGRYERRRCALRFERVLGAQHQALPLQSKDAAAELLALQFHALEPPEGYITMIFSGRGAVRIHVECIEAELRDLGPAWQTRIRPHHHHQPDVAASKEGE
jgi:hypothetical protein